MPPSRRSARRRAALLLLASLVALAVAAGAVSTLSPATHGPRLMHLMYLPWDAHQRLKADPDEFDHAYLHRTRERFPDWDVRMWTLPALRTLVQGAYPGVWEQAMASYHRPTQLVDLFRWLVVFHFGGVYVQYDTALLVSPASLLPRQSKTVRLFTERVLSRQQCEDAGRRWAIRQGAPEEPVRVMNQVFSASAQRQPFIGLVWRCILANMAWAPREDYDVLYLGANALVSTLYDREGRSDDSVELVSQRTTRRLFAVSSRGSWRTD